MEFEKKIEIRALLRAQLSPSRIAGVVGCSRTTVYATMKAIEDGEDLKRKGHKTRDDRIIDDDFLDALVVELSKDLGKSMRAIARDSGLSDRTIRTHVRPWIESSFPNKNYVWQQDSAPGHKAKSTQKWLKQHFADHWSPDLWPPSSPDANPLDYGVWGVLKGKASNQHHATVDSLVQAVDDVWDNLSEDFIKKTCSRFRGRLEAIVAANGGHIED